MPDVQTVVHSGGGNAPTDRQLNAVTARNEARTPAARPTAGPQSERRLDASIRPVGPDCTEAEKVGVLRIGRRRIEVVDRRWLAHRARGTVAGSVGPLWQT